MLRSQQEMFLLVISLVNSCILKVQKIDASQKILKTQGPRVEWVGHSWPMLSESKWQLEQTPHTYDEKTRVTVKTLNMMKVMKNMVLEGCTMKITNRTPHPKSGATHISSARSRWAKAQFPSTSMKKISWGRDVKSREHIASGICPTT